MSVAFATTIVPVPCAPWRGDGERLAEVVRLYPPSEKSISAPLRLTRRGVAVLAGSVALLAVGLVLAAWVSAPVAHAAGTRSGPASVVVHSGDTLWLIAGRIAPDRDTWAEVADLRRINGLSDVDLAVGQVLRTR